eukprot:Gb_33539 [translate_table: standard]
MRGNSIDRIRNFKPKYRGPCIVCFEKGSIVNSINNLPCVCQLNSLTNTIAATRPASVDEPAGCAMFVHFFRKHGGVSCGMKHYECCSKTCRECGLWLLYTIFSTSNQSCISTDKMVHCLRKCQLAHRWQNPKGITS